MSGVVGAWRIRLMILLTVILVSMYIVNGFFYNVDIDNDGYLNNDNLSINYNDTTEGVNEGDNFITFITSLGDYITFGNINNVYARLLINLFSTICFLIIGYIVYTFIKEWIPW